MGIALSTLPSMKIVGKTIETTTKNNQHFEDIKRLWSEINNSELAEKLMYLRDSDDKRFVGVCTLINGDYFSYTAGVVTDKPAIDGCSTVTVPERKWAMRPFINEEIDLLDVINRHFRAELQKAGYTLYENVDMELYSMDEETSEMCGSLLIGVVDEPK